MNNNNSVKDFSEKRIILTVIIAAVLLFAGLFLIFGDKLKTGQSGETLTEDNGFDLSNLYSQPETEEIFYEMRNEDPLMSVSQMVSFSCQVDISDSFYSTSYNRLSLYVNGDRFRIESPSRTVIYDGNKMYISSPVYDVKTDEGSFFWYTETGLVSFDSLRERAYAENADISLLSDGMNAVIQFHDNENDRHEKYTVSLLYGIVVSGEIIEHNVTVRSFSLSDFYVLDKSSETAELFAVPD